MYGIHSGSYDDSHWPEITVLNDLFETPFLSLSKTTVVQLVLSFITQDTNLCNFSPIRFFLIFIVTFSKTCGSNEQFLLSLY